MKSKYLRPTASAFVLLALVSCNQGDDRLAEKSRLEGKAQAEAQLEAQIKAKDQLIEIARYQGKAQAEAQLEAQLKAKDQLIEIARGQGKAQAEAELKVQIENIDLLVQKARAEGKVQAEIEINSQNANLTEKAQKMEIDLASRHLFYQAVQGTYEGEVTTKKGAFSLRITLVPSLPPYLGARTRQLEEITADINNLYLKAQVILWNPKNELSSVGCRVDNIRPDYVKGTLSVTTADCPNVYMLTVSDEAVISMLKKESGQNPSVSDTAKSISSQIQSGKIGRVAALVGDVRPTTNAAIYPISAKRVEKK